MAFYEVIDKLAEKYGGRLYCEELFDTIRAVTDNDIFLNDRGTYGTFAVRLVQSNVTPEVFYVIRDTVHRNTRENEQEANAILDELFYEMDLASVILDYSLKTAHILAEVIPSFEKMLTKAIKTDYFMNMLLYPRYYLKDVGYKTFDDITKKLPEIDFIVQHSTLHEDFLIKDVSSIPDRWPRNILSFVRGETYEWAPYLIKWIIRKPSLLDHPELAQCREDLVRLLLEKEEELSHEFQGYFPVGEDEVPSLPRIISTVVGDETELRARKYIRK